MIINKKMFDFCLCFPNSPRTELVFILLFHKHTRSTCAPFLNVNYVHLKTNYSRYKIYKVLQQL